MKLSKRQLLPLIGIILLIIALPFSVNLVQKAQKYLTKAFGQPANIVVDANIVLGPLPRPWLALAQGGEEKNTLFSGVTSEVKALQPQYIRIDHLYDFYNVVNKNGDTISFNWTEMDKVVDQILQMGALPFLSLSYMPPAIAQNGDILSPPNNWADWSQVIQATIQHYSGKNERNLNNVAYEVWNEPDLFGNWRIGGQKDYRTLYLYAIKGANRVQNTNAFKIGGPSVTAPYENWVDGFLNYTVQNKLRIDFYSWHRYSTDPEKFLDDINKVDTWLFQNAGYTLQKYMTEWGSVSDGSPLHDSNFDAAHTVATIANLLQRVDLAFTFEVKDGPGPAGKQYWGRWGILTNESGGSIEKKPRYYALALLNRMSGKRISLKGEGTWVTGFASQDGSETNIILANLDPDNKHYEAVPLTVNNLSNGNYSYKETFLSGEGRSLNETVTNGTLQKQISFSANNIVVVELRKI